MNQLYDHVIDVINHSEFLTSDFVETVKRVVYETNEITDDEWKDIYSKNDHPDFLELLMKTEETPKYILSDIINNLFKNVKEGSPVYSSIIPIIKEAIKRVDLDEDMCEKISEIISVPSFSNSIYNFFNNIEESKANDSAALFSSIVCSDTFLNYFIKNSTTFKKHLNEEGIYLYLLCMFCKDENLLKPFLEYENENVNVAFAITNNPFVSDGLRNAAFEIQNKDPVTEILSKTDFVLDLSVNMLLDSISSNSSPDAILYKFLYDLLYKNKLSDDKIINVINALTKTCNQFSSCNVHDFFISYAKKIVDVIALKYDNPDVLEECCFLGEAIKHKYGHFITAAPLIQSYNLLCSRNLSSDIVEFHLNALFDMAKETPLKFTSTYWFDLMKTIGENIEQINASSEFKDNFIEKIIDLKNLNINAGLSVVKNLPIKYLDKIINTQKELMDTKSIKKIDTTGNVYLLELPFDYAKINKTFRNIESLNVVEVFYKYFDAYRKQSPSAISQEEHFLPPLLTEEEYEKFCKLAKDFRLELTIRKIRDGFDSFKSALLRKSVQHIFKSQSGIFTYHPEYDFFSISEPQVLRLKNREELVENLRKETNDSLTKMYNFFKDTNTNTINNGEKVMLVNPVNVALKVEGYSVYYSALEEVLIEKNIIKNKSKNKRKKIDANTEER